MVDTFRPNTKVLAYHGPLIYEAKVIKIHEKDKSYVETHETKRESAEIANLPKHLDTVDAYLLHYKGWKAKWDEWVPIERVLEYNDDNLQLQKDVKAANTKKPKPTVKTEDTKINSSSPSSNKNSDSNNNNGNNNKSSSSKKRPAGSTTASSSLNGSSNGTSKKKTKKEKTYEISFNVKPVIKFLMVDDWEFITKDRKLVDLPSAININKILKDYFTLKKADKSVSKQNLDIIDEFLKGLKIYFNKSLGLILLYRSERLQYLNLLQEHGEDVELSSIYGIEHLLRLFISLPGLISETSMDAVSLGVLGAQSEFFLDHLADNLSKYVNDYINVSPAYDRLSRH